MAHLIFWFHELEAKDNVIVGKKCANLGEMAKRGLPVPPGFALSIVLYERFLEETGIGEKINRILENFGELKAPKVSLLDEISQKIRKIIDEQEMPKWMRGLILEYYKELCEKAGSERVSVRSAGVESRPGMFETYLNVRGGEELLEKIKKVWSSAFTTRAIAYRINKGLSLTEDRLGVAVVKMINASSSGIGFTVDPISADLSKIIIEANYGLGEGVVSGGENVDRFILEKDSLTLLQKVIGKKKRYVALKEVGVEWEDVPQQMQESSCLSEEEIKEVAKMAKYLEICFGHPQDIEWAFDKDINFPKNFFLLQTRNAKVAAKKAVTPTERIVDMIARRFL